jgi:hypothetical protein
MKIEYSMPPRCDMCSNDTAEFYPPDNEIGYTGLCKDCFNIFYEENTNLFKNKIMEIFNRPGEGLPPGTWIFGVLNEGNIEKHTIHLIEYTEWQDIYLFLNKCVPGASNLSIKGFIMVA